MEIFTHLNDFINVGCRTVSTKANSYGGDFESEFEFKQNVKFNLMFICLWYFDTNLRNAVLTNLRKLGIIVTS